MPSITFLGAAGTVTGSSFLLDMEERRILVDCGMFQGQDEEQWGNQFPESVDIRGIDYIVLTHAHLDHIGRFPLLIRRGFRGKVLATPPTMDLARIILMDAAEIQEEEARNRRNRRRRGGGNALESPPLYTVKDVLLSFSFLNTPLPYNRQRAAGGGIEITLKDAGHILGSSFVEIRSRRKRGEGRAIVFSGDLGSRGRPILRNPANRTGGETLIVESTYGDREHRTFDESVLEFREAIHRTFERGGNVIIPSFALERTQEVLYILRGMYLSGEFPEEGMVFLDSPLAISATDIFHRHSKYFDRQAGREMKGHGTIFDFPMVTYTRAAKESMLINEIKGGAIIIAGSGMCTGGRVLHHLKHNIWREECSVIFVGYQVKDTLGREIIDGASSIELFGETTPVRAEIHTIGGFSAHAGRTELLEWVKGNEGDGRGALPERVILVHGEDNGRSSLSRGVEGLGIRDVKAPYFGERVEI